MLRRWKPSMVLVAALSLILAACPSDPDADPPVGAPDELEGEPVTIGVLGPTTGLFAAMGQMGRRGAELAAAHINEDGGVLDGRPIQVQVRDTEVDPATAVRSARELHDLQDIRLFVGVVSSAVALAMSEVMEEIDGSLILSAAQTTRATGLDWSPYIFRVTENAGIRSEGQARIIAERYPEVNRWANISPDYEYGHSAWEHFQRVMTEVNPDFEVVESRFPPFGQGGGYRPDMSAAAGSGAVGLFTAFFSGDLIPFVREGVGFGFFDDIDVVVVSYLDHEVRFTLGDEMVEMWGSEGYLPGEFDQYPEAVRFDEDYIERWGEDDFNIENGIALMYYNAVHAYAAAIEEAGTDDPPAVREALAGIEFDSPVGPIWIRPEDHQAARLQVPFMHIIPDADTEEGWRVEHEIYGEEAVQPAEVMREW